MDPGLTDRAMRVHRLLMLALVGSALWGGKAQDTQGIGPCQTQEHYSLSSWTTANIEVAHCLQTDGSFTTALLFTGCDNADRGMTLAEAKAHCLQFGQCAGITCTDTSGTHCSACKGKQLFTSDQSQCYGYKQSCQRCPAGQVQDSTGWGREDCPAGKAVNTDGSTPNFNMPAESLADVERLQVIILSVAAGLFVILFIVLPKIAPVSFLHSMDMFDTVHASDLILIGAANTTHVFQAQYYELKEDYNDLKEVYTDLQQQHEELRSMVVALQQRATPIEL